MDCQAFLDFCKSNEADGEEILEMITEACYGTNVENVSVNELHRSDAINAVYGGTIKYKDKEYDFILESGNCNGTVMLEWSNNGDIYYSAPEPVKYTFIPAEYNYDRYFAPGDKTEEHYKAKAKKMGTQSRSI
jgi:hypothetical protein